MKRPLLHLVSLALMAVLTATPTFAAICAERCEVEATLTPASSSHCSRHASQARAADHIGRHAAPATAAATLSHESACCRRSTVLAAVPTKSLRVDAAAALASVSPPVAASSVRWRDALGHGSPGSPGPSAHPRSPLVLRI